MSCVETKRWLPCAVKQDVNAFDYASDVLRNDLLFIYALLKITNIETEHVWLGEVLMNYQKMGGYVPVNEIGVKKGLAAGVTKEICEYL